MILLPGFFPSCITSSRVPPVCSHCCAGRLQAPFYAIPAAPAETLDQWGENVQTTICSGKTNPVKDCVDFTAWRNGVQLLRVSVTDAFSPYLANVHIRLCPLASLNNLNPALPSLIPLTLRVKKLSFAAAFIFTSSATGCASSVMWQAPPLCYQRWSFLNIYNCLYTKPQQTK